MKRHRLSWLHHRLRMRFRSWMLGDCCCCCCCCCCREEWSHHCHPIQTTWQSNPAQTTMNEMKMSEDRKWTKCEKTQEEDEPQQLILRLRPLRRWLTSNNTAKYQQSEPQKRPYCERIWEAALSIASHHRNLNNHPIIHSFSNRANLWLHSRSELLLANAWAHLWTTDPEQID